MAPGATLLIASAGLALSASAGDVRAPFGAVALTTVTLAAHENLAVASCAQEKPGGLIVQDTSGSTSVVAGLSDAPILVARGPPG